MVPSIGAAGAPTLATGANAGTLLRRAGARPWRLAMLLFAAAMVGAALYGGVRWFTPVPIGDAWDGIVGFRLHQQAGSVGIWWAQHNEHRIVLARGLFWLDFELFGGRTVFLIVANYALVGAAIALFAALVRSAFRRDGGSAPDAERLFTLGLAAWLFQWMQFENLTRPFQSQFFLATLVPLAALYFLYRATVPVSPRRDFVIACVLGVASIGTMANGVLALPLMVVYAALTRQGWRRIVVLGLLAALTLAAYFHGYFAIRGHGSLGQALREQPLALVHYWLAYVGGPFQKLAAMTNHGRTLAVVMGAVFALLALAAAARALRRPAASALELALLAFIAYFCATALATAGGRVNFGIEQAFSSRYTTPALMAWGCLLVLHAQALARWFGARPRAAVAAGLLFALPMLNAQLEALQPRSGEVLELESGALALVLQVRDEHQVLHLYPVYEPLRRTADHAEQARLAIYGQFPFEQLREQLGQPAPARPAAQCRGFVDAVEVLGTDPRFLRVSGWLFDPASRSVPRRARFVTAEGRTAGFALTGGPRQDVAQAVGWRARGAGFRGYVLADELANHPANQPAAHPAGAPLVLQDDAGACHLPLQWPRP